VSRSGLTFDDVAAMGAELPAVAAGTSYGTPALHVRKRFMARLSDGDSDVMVLKPVYEDEQRFLMETQPGVFFTTDHYRGYPTILIRLSKADRGQVRELLVESWRRVAPAKLVAEYDAIGAGTAVTPAARKRAATKAVAKGESSPIKPAKVKAAKR
jgi:hypothetical protein